MNWLLDVPGFRVPTVFWPHVIIVVFNLTAGLVMFLIFYFREPITLAWGCYAPGSTIQDLKYGLCPSFINDEQNAHPPVCDEPGTRCGEELIRWKTIFNDLLVDTALCAFASFSLYIITVPAKTKFYVLSRGLVYVEHNKST